MNSGRLGRTGLCKTVLRYLKTRRPQTVFFRFCSAKSYSTIFSKQNGTSIRLMEMSESPASQCGETQLNARSVIMNSPLGLRTWIALLFFVAVVPFAVKAQEKETKPAESQAAAKPAETPKEESSVTEHSTKIGGQTIPYRATAQTILLKDDKGEPAALLYSTAYTRNDVKDLSQRPLAFLYNGGPGSSSVWLHMGSVSPKRVITVNAGVTPPAPYKVADNPECLLDKTDLVFVDPIGTGFSHAVGKAQDKDFWGVDQDVKSLAQFIATWVTRNNRWNSPKFLVGESYGTFRSAALSNYLQSHDGMYFNGIDLISSVLDLRTLSFLPSDDMSYIFYLPSYAATAWYHKMLQDRPDNLNAFVEDARRFAKTEYASALMKGSQLTSAEKTDIAKK